MTKEQMEMIEACEENSEQLTDWESHFIDDLSRKDDLTSGQAEKLR